MPSNIKGLDGWTMDYKETHTGNSNIKGLSGWSMDYKETYVGYNEDGYLKNSTGDSQLDAITKDGWRKVPDSNPASFEKNPPVGGSSDWKTSAKNQGYKYNSETGKYQKSLGVSSGAIKGFELFEIKSEEQLKESMELLNKHNATSKELLNKYTPKVVESYDGTTMKWPEEWTTTSDMPNYTSEVGTQDNITSLFFSGLDLSSDPELNLSNSFDDVFDSFNQIQNEVFNKIPLDDNGFLDFSFLPFTQPVDSLLKAAATTPEMVFKNIPLLGNKLAVDLVKLKSTIDEAYSHQLSLKDLMPGVMKSDVIDEVLYDVTQMPESVQQFLSQIKGGITGPLNTLYESLTYQVESVTEDFVNSSGLGSAISGAANAVREGSSYIANISKLAGMVPYAMSKIKSGIVDQFKQYVSEEVSNIPFVNNLKYLTGFINDRTRVVNDLLHQISPILDSASAFGGRNLADLLSNQSQLEGLFRNARFNPLTQFSNQLNSFINMRGNMLLNAIDKSVNIKEKAADLINRTFQPLDIINNVLNNSDLYEFSTKDDTWALFDYNRVSNLMDLGQVKFREEMLWQISSEIINNISNDFVDDSLVTLDNYLQSLTNSEVDTLIDSIDTGVADYNIDKSNLLLYNLLTKSHDITDTIFLTDSNIVDALSFSSTYFSNSIPNTTLKETFSNFKDIIHRGFTMGSFDSTKTEDMLLYLKTNDITNLDDRERTRLQALLDLTPVDELQEYIDYFNELKDELPYVQPTNSSINYELGEADPDYIPDYEIWERED